MSETKTRKSTLLCLEMEDRHVTLTEVSPGVFYSAVFDGHGGAKVAEFAQVKKKID